MSSARTRRTVLIAAAVAIAVAAALAVLLVAVVPGGDDEEEAEQPLPFREGVLATPADEFVESVGVNTHLHYSSSPYEDFEAVKEALEELGVRHIRDYPVPESVEELHELGAAGIRLTAIMGTAAPRQWMPHDLEDLHEVVREVLPAVAAVEGVNEWDISDDPDWPENLRIHQQALWEMVRGDDDTEHLPVLAPSITWAANMDDVGDLSAWSDFGNIHPYPGGREPEARVETDIGTHQRTVVTPSTPVMATETGYHNAVGHGRGHPGVSDEVAAVYLPRLYLHYFALGVPRTFAYELVDQDDDLTERESSFGLVRHDFTPKPAFVALRDLIALLADPGPEFQPGRLDYELVDADDDTRHLLLQKRDGTFYLAIWHASSIWEANRGAPREAETRTVTLKVAQPLAEATIRSIGDGADPVRTFESPSEIALEVTPEVQIVELVPDQINAP